jgi:hypothetical protein
VRSRSLASSRARSRSARAREQISSAMTVSSAAIARVSALRPASSRVHAIAPRTRSLFTWYSPGVMWFRFRCRRMGQRPRSAFPRSPAQRQCRAPHARSRRAGRVRDRRRLLAAGQHSRARSPTRSRPGTTALPRCPALRGIGQRRYRCPGRPGARTGRQARAEQGGLQAATLASSRPGASASSHSTRANPLRERGDPCPSTGSPVRAQMAGGRGMAQRYETACRADTRKRFDHTPQIGGGEFAPRPEVTDADAAAGSSRPSGQPTAWAGTRRGWR